MRAEILLAWDPKPLMQMQKFSGPSVRPQEALGSDWSVGVAREALAAIDEVTVGWVVADEGGEMLAASGLGDVDDEVSPLSAPRGVAAARSGGSDSGGRLGSC